MPDSGWRQSKKQEMAKRERTGRGRGGQREPAETADNNFKSVMLAANLRTRVSNQRQRASLLSFSFSPPPTLCLTVRDYVCVSVCFGTWLTPIRQCAIN